MDQIAVISTHGNAYQLIAPDSFLFQKESNGTFHPFDLRQSAPHKEAINHWLVVGNALTHYTNVKDLIRQGHDVVWITPEHIHSAWLHEVRKLALEAQTKLHISLGCEFVDTDPNIYSEIKECFFIEFFRPVPPTFSLLKALSEQVYWAFQVFDGPAKKIFVTAHAHASSLQFIQVQIAFENHSEISLRVDNFFNKEEVLRFYHPKTGIKTTQEKDGSYENAMLYHHFNTSPQECLAFIRKKYLEKNTYPINLSHLDVYQNTVEAMQLIESKLKSSLDINIVLK